MPAIYVRCPECRARFKFPQFLPGRKVQCPECGGVFVLNEDHAELPPALLERPDEVWPAKSDGGETPARRPVQATAPTKGRGGVLGALLGCGLLVLMIAAGLGLIIWWLAPEDDLALETQDYGDARGQFNTQLRMMVRSPQRYDPHARLPDAVREVTYPSGKRSLKAWLAIPETKARRYPAVLFVHGGYNLDPEDWNQAEPFLDSGYAVMLPTVRGENGQPGNFTLGYDEVDDVIAAAEHLAGMRRIDPDHIYIAGHSNGGTLALLASMVSHRFRAVASLSGSCDARLWAAFVRQEYGFLPFDPRNRRELKMRSPQPFAKSFKCPARLYYGEAADELPRLAESCRRTASAAHADGLDVEAEGVPGDHMSMVLPGVRAAIAFFQRNQ